MKRTDKTTTVARMEEAFQKTPHVVLTDYKGLTANQTNELRRRTILFGARFKM